ncbi:hypothetical protein [Streptomyces chartreusis]|uniref:hypothetical protein n=1 Tax=Streptomyces chartreusis TaxID=1969 RepID=UPI003626DE11
MARKALVGIGAAVLLTTGGTATALAQDGYSTQDARGVKALRPRPGRPRGHGTAADARLSGQAADRR